MDPARSMETLFSKRCYINWIKKKINEPRNSWMGVTRGQTIITDVVAAAAFGTLGPVAIVFHV